MCKDIDPGAGSDLRIFEPDGVRQNFPVMTMRLVDEGGQRLFVHAGHVWRSTVPPAIGKDFDHIRLVGGQPRQRRPRLVRRRDLEREEVAPASLRSVSTRCRQSRRQTESWRDDSPLTDQSPHRFKRLRIGAEIDYRGYSAIEIRFQILRPIANDAGRRGVGEVRVKIEEPRQQRHPLGPDHPRTCRDLDSLANRLDSLAADDDRSRKWLPPRSVNDRRSNDRCYGDRCYGDRCHRTITRRLLKTRHSGAVAKKTAGKTAKKTYGHCNYY